MRSLNQVRVLIVGWKPNSNQFLRSVLASLGLPSFTRLLRSDEALTLLREQGFELVICTEEAEPLPPGQFTQALRRDSYSRDPTVPVIVITSSITLKDFQMLRDAGADDIMCPPMSAESIEKRLQRLLLQPRKYVNSKAFQGPERRRGPRSDFVGEERRRGEEAIFYQPPRAKKD